MMRFIKTVILAVAVGAVAGCGMTAADWGAVAEGIERGVNQSQGQLEAIRAAKERKRKQ